MQSSKNDLKSESSKHSLHANCKKKQKLEKEEFEAEMTILKCQKKKIEISAEEEIQALTEKLQAVSEKRDFAENLLKKAIKGESLPAAELRRVFGSKDSSLAKISAAERLRSERSDISDFQSDTRPEAKLAGLPRAKPVGIYLSPAKQVAAFQHIACFPQVAVPSAAQVSVLPQISGLSSTGLSSTGLPSAGLPSTGLPLQNEAQGYSKALTPSFSLLASMNSRHSPLVKSRARTHVIQFEKILKEQSANVKQIHDRALEMVTSGSDGGHFTGKCGRGQCAITRNTTNYFCVTCLLSSGDEGSKAHICKKHWQSHLCYKFGTGIRTTPDGLLALIDEFMKYQKEREEEVA